MRTCYNLDNDVRPKWITGEDENRVFFLDLKRTLKIYSNDFVCRSAMTTEMTRPSKAKSTSFPINFQIFTSFHVFESSIPALFLP